APRIVSRCFHDERPSGVVPVSVQPHVNSVVVPVVEVWEGKGRVRLVQLPQYFLAPCHNHIVHVRRSFPVRQDGRLPVLAALPRYSRGAAGTQAGEVKARRRTSSSGLHLCRTATHQPTTRSAGPRALSVNWSIT